MKIKFKQGMAMFLALLMLVSVVFDFFWTKSVRVDGGADKAQRSNAGILQPDMEPNLNYQNYDVYGNLVSSHLIGEEGGYMRVQTVEVKTAKMVKAIIFM